MRQAYGMRPGMSMITVARDAPTKWNSPKMFGFISIEWSELQAPSTSNKVMRSSHISLNLAQI